ncbi:MAG TPA: NAD(P)H-dependent glycerol-3-phosphate dehydrogenase [Solirubrobacteraceae bacterium]|nr:NAD(P)H-dependent glycerol-3-phosphate dehydrogenase [Solirubrobacteraceae bacterium]
MSDSDPQPPGAHRALGRPMLGSRRVTIIGAGSFGTALAVVFARAGIRASLQAHTAEQAHELRSAGENRRYLPGIDLPGALRIEALGDSLGRSELIFLAVPARAFQGLVESLAATDLRPDAALISLTKGLTSAAGAPPTTLLADRFGADRVACIGGPAHAQEMVRAGAALVAAARREQLAGSIAQLLGRAGLVCEISDDPLGVELAGAAKNAAALAAGATQSQGPNAAGAAAGHIFGEVYRYAARLGARPESFIGLAGTGDLVATALAAQSRNRRAGELLAQGVSAGEIPGRIGQAVEALESVGLLASAIESAGVQAPVLSALGRLIGGELPLQEWVALVRATVPPPARFGARRARRRRASGGLGALLARIWQALLRRG